MSHLARLKGKKTVQCVHCALWIVNWNQLFNRLIKSNCQDCLHALNWELNLSTFVHCVILLLTTKLLLTIALKISKTIEDKCWSGDWFPPDGPLVLRQTLFTFNRKISHLAEKVHRKSFTHLRKNSQEKITHRRKKSQENHTRH